MAAVGLSVLVHAVITTGGPPGRGPGAASFPARAALEVGFLEINPDSLLVPAPAHTEVHTTAPALRNERKKTPVPRAGALPVERASASATAGPAHIPDPTYYGARQLDVYPMLASTLRLDDREAAHTSQRTGRVLLFVLIDAEGRVNEVSVIESEPPGVFDERTRAAFQAARFMPALKNGRPVKSRLLVNVDYGDSAKR